ncbi:MAG TPA: BatD family protein [Candidatus Binatia bacterium]|jgi:hypothetical protein|nr:BatD family protein [Candidatus Binatia bacterium]
MLLVLVPLMAGAEVRLRAELGSSSPVRVGQRTLVVVTLTSPMPFTDAPILDLPRIPGAILMQPDVHPVLGSETIDGTTWVAQRHELAFFALRAGAFTIPSFVVRAGGQRLSTPAFTVTADLPAGVDDAFGLVTTTSFAMTEHWEPAPGKARVGDAFTRTVTRIVVDVPGMLLPPLPVGEAGTLAVYPKAPLVTDRTERGDFTGVRTDVVTYVATQSETVTLPAVHFRWWNLSQHALVTETLPAVTFEIGAAPLSRGTWTRRLVLAAVLLAALAWWRGRAAASWWRRRRVARATSERGRFAELQHACHDGDPRVAYAALLRWLETANPGPRCPTLADDLLAPHPDPELRRAVDALETAIIAPRGSWDGRALASALDRIRPHVRHAGVAALPDLNPPSRLASRRLSQYASGR